jgi:hypothetical protein
MRNIGNKIKRNEEKSERIEVLYTRKESGKEDGNRNKVKGRNETG